MRRLTSITLFLLTSTWISYAQEGTYDSQSTGEDGALIVRGTLSPIEDFESVYDAARDEVLVFGGKNYDFRDEVSETYVFDGVEWFKKETEVVPPAVDEDYTLAYDALNERVVMYIGGLTTVYSCWTWDGNDWTEIDSPDPEKPYDNVGMAYDAARQEIVLVLKDYSTTDTETWVLGESGWTQKEVTTVPTASFGHEVIYDPGAQKIFLFSRNSPYQCWSWDGNDWTRIESGDIERDLESGGLTYDPNQGGIVFLGNSEESYLFNGTSWTELTGVPEVFVVGADYIIFHP